MFFLCVCVCIIPYLFSFNDVTMSHDIVSLS